MTNYKKYMLLLKQLYYINNILIAIKINKAAKYIMLITIIILYIAMTIIYIAIL